MEYNLDTARNIFLKELKNNPQNPNLRKIKKALDFSQKAHQGDLRKSGEPYFIHPLETAKNLNKWEQDTESICAGLLHDVVEDTPLTLSNIRKEFGSQITNLVDGVTKVSEVDFHRNKKEKFANNLRKMFLAMSKDLRVVVIKLADRLHNMKTIQYLSPQAQSKLSEETRSVYAPLAYKMGMSEVSGDLRELCFKTQRPKDFQWVTEYAKQAMDKREEIIKAINFELEHIFKKEPLKLIKTETRRKNWYSLFAKLHRKEINKNLDEVYDLVITCVVVPKKRDCYTALGIIHENYKPVPHVGISNFIAQPKPNGYEALHTRVFDKNSGSIFEIQIRDKNMHQRADFGLAIHLTHAQTDSEKVEKIRYWTQKLIEWQENFMKEESEQFLGELAEKVLKPDIYVIDKELGVVPVAEGSTIKDYLKATNRPAKSTVLLDKKQMGPSAKILSGSFIEVSSN
ncbi:MAG: HD domain-containing protein [Patescibacteria group bacterium]|nr:HD domain-containing protein [Patescibacteria group bacterium]